MMTEVKRIFRNETWRKNCERERERERERETETERRVKKREKGARYLHLSVIGSFSSLETSLLLGPAAFISERNSLEISFVTVCA